MWRSCTLSLEKAILMGLRSGEYGGIQEQTAMRFGGCGCLFAAVSGKVIEDDRRAGGDLRDQYLADIG